MTVLRNAMEDNYWVVKLRKGAIDDSIISSNALFISHFSTCQRTDK